MYKKNFKNEFMCIEFCPNRLLIKFKLNISGATTTSSTLNPWLYNQFNKRLISDRRLYHHVTTY